MRKIMQATQNTTQKKERLIDALMGNEPLKLAIFDAFTKLKYNFNNKIAQEDESLITARLPENSVLKPKKKV